MNSDTKISMSLSRLLRHEAIKDGVHISSDGWVSTSDTLIWLNNELKKGPKITIEDLKRIVNNDMKQRYSLNEIKGLIRANQGHSMNLNIKMIPITLENSPDYIVHGTYFRFLNKIKKEGLSKMKRQHIHFAVNDTKNDSQVISGMRTNCEVLIWIDIKKAINDGYEFFISDNGVILTEGKNGIIPPDYFSFVNNREDGCTIIQTELPKPELSIVNTQKKPSILSDNEKEIRKAKKILKEISELKKQREAGVKLEANQLTKLKREEQLLAVINS